MASDGKIKDKPVVAYNWSIAGGFIGVFVALSLVALAVNMSQGSPYDVVSNNYYVFYGVGVWCFAACTVIIYCARKLNSHPSEHSKWGALITVLALVSFGGFFSIVGGILALTYKPKLDSSPQQTWNEQRMPQQQDYNQRSKPLTCGQCGQAVEANTKFCPECGHSTSASPQFQPSPQSQTSTANARQLPAESGKTFCGNCGSRLEPGARFCPDCGQQNE